LFVYLDQNNIKLQTAKNLLASILSQLIQFKDAEDISPQFREAYQGSRRGASPPLLRDGCLKQGSKLCGNRSCVRDMLYTELKSYAAPYLIIDARDECGEETRAWLDDELINLQDIGVRVMTTCRQIEEPTRKPIFCNSCPLPKDGDIESRRAIRLYWQCIKCDDFDICQTCKDKGVACSVDPSHKLREAPEVEMRIQTPDEAMKEYLKSEMIRDRGDDRDNRRRDKRVRPHASATKFGRILKKMKPDMLEAIISTIVQKSAGVFLFAKLYLATLRVQLTVEKVWLSLQSLPTTLDKIYEQWMQSRILAQNEEYSETAINILSLLTIAFQPLTLKALLHALAVRPNDTTINPDSLIDEYSVRELTQGLVLIEPHEDPDRSPVRLFHLTLQEYLRENATRWLPSADRSIAAKCLMYLGLDPFAQPCTRHIEFKAKIPEYPFVEYAAQYWGDHFVAATAKEKDPSLELTAAEYLKDPGRVAALSQAAWCTQNHRPNGWDVRRRVEGLHFAAWFGLDGLISLLAAHCNINTREQTYQQTPLMYACRKGHLSAVQKLLELGADVNIRSGRGRTALIEAVEADQTGVVDVLLNLKGNEIKINATCPEQFDRPALILAVRKGNIDIVQRLLSHDRVDVNAQDSGGFTALAHATLRHGNLAYELRELNGDAKGSVQLTGKKLRQCGVVLGLLLQREDLEVDRVEALGRSPLILAAEKNDSATVKMLLERGADPNLRDHQNGGVAMIRAAERGHLTVLETMVDHPLSADCVDENGRGLLHCAAGSNSSEAPVCIRLLTGEGLDVNKTDNKGLTPLHEAARAGSLDNVETLLEFGAERSVEDCFKRTPLRVAWIYEREDLIHHLKYDNEIKSAEKWTRPLWSLAKNGEKDTIAKIMEENPKSVLVDREQLTNDTALHWAVRANQIESLKQLIQNDHAQLHLDLTNFQNRTALHTAAWSDNQDAARVLIEKRANLNAKDKWDSTPLMIAQTKWHYDFAVILCGAEGIDLSIKGLDLKTMLFRAVDLNNAEAVRNLVDGGVDILQRNDEWKTALEVAIEKGEEAEDICRILATRTFYVKPASGEQTEAGSAVPELGRTASQPAMSRPAFRMPLDALDDGTGVEGRSISEPAMRVQPQEHHDANLQAVQWPEIPPSPPLTPQLHRVSTVREPIPN
jgi:ankyrin repeat protein